MRLLLGTPSGPDPESVYLAPREHPGRPWVMANMVAGLDGSTAVDGRVRGLSGPADRGLFRFLRSLADVVLVGAGTVRAEGYGPVKLTDEQRTARAGRGQAAAAPPVAVVSRSLDLDLEGPLFADPEHRPIVVTSAAADAALLTKEGRAEVIVAGDDEVDLVSLLDAFADRGYRVVLTEGGPRLLSELIDNDLLDELCLTLAPLIGGDPLAVAETNLAGLRRFELVSAITEDGHLFLRYLTERP